MATTERTVEAIDLSQLGRGLYTETVTIDPTVDANAPSSPINEALFNEKGEETGKIVYKALLSAPEEGATDFDGNPRPLVERIGGMTKPKDGSESKPWSALKINFNVKVVEFADTNMDQRQLIGRAGKTFEENMTTFTRTKDGATFSPLFDFAQRLGLAPAVAKNQDGTPVTQTIDNEQLVLAVAQHIASGQAVVGVTVKWVANWIEGEGGKRGKYEYQYQRNFPRNQQGVPQPVANTRTKIATYEKLA